MCVNISFRAIRSRESKAREFCADRFALIHEAIHRIAYTWVHFGASFEIKNACLRLLHCLLYRHLVTIVIKKFAPPKSTSPWCVSHNPVINHWTALIKMWRLPPFSSSPLNIRSIQAFAPAVAIDHDLRNARPSYPTRSHLKFINLRTGKWVRVS